MKKNIIDLQKFASKEEYKPAIGGVYFTGRKAIATDSYRLVEVEQKKEESREPAIYKLKDIKVKGDFEIKDNKLIDGLTETLLSKVEGDYPDYQAIIPTGEPLIELDINAKYLAEILKVMENTDKLTNKVKIKIYQNNKPVIIEAENDDQKIMSLIMPVIMK